MRPTAAPGEALSPLANDCRVFFVAGGIMGWSNWSIWSPVTRVTAVSLLIMPSCTRSTAIFYGGFAGAFAVAGLQEEEVAVLDCKFHILHVGVVFFQLFLDGFQFVVHFGIGFFKGCQGLRGTDAGHHVFSLGVHEVLAVKVVFAGGGIAAEAYAGSRFVGPVAEHH